MRKILLAGACLFVLSTSPAQAFLGKVTGFVDDVVGGITGGGKAVAGIPKGMLEVLENILDQIELVADLAQQPERLEELSQYATERALRAAAYGQLGAQLKANLEPLRIFFDRDVSNVIRGLYGSPGAAAHANLARQLRLANNSYADALGKLANDYISAQAFLSAASLINAAGLKAPWWLGYITNEATLDIAAYNRNVAYVDNMKKQIDAHEEAMRLAAIGDAIERQAAFEKALLEQGRRCAEGRCKYVRRVD